jgi:hypothetical protein
MQQVNMYYVNSSNVKLFVTCSFRSFITMGIRLYKRHRSGVKVVCNTKFCYITFQLKIFFLNTVLHFIYFEFSHVQTLELHNIKYHGLLLNINF